MYNRQFFRPVNLILRMALVIFLLLIAGCQAFPQKPPAQPGVTQSLESTTAALSPNSTPLQPDQAPGPTRTTTPSQTTPTSIEMASVTPTLISEPLTQQPALPPSGGPQLAFLNNQDVWLLDQPTGKPYALTVLAIFLAAACLRMDNVVRFNGRSLCHHSDGSVRTACLELVDDNQANPAHIIGHLTMMDCSVESFNPCNKIIGG
jgi:hypothetical protein